MDETYWAASFLQSLLFQVDARDPATLTIVAVFIDKFLAPINQRYAEVGLLIWKCFRQGTWPKRIVLEDGTAQVTTGASSEALDPHLSRCLDWHRIRS